MTAQGWLQIALYLVVLTALTPLLGAYMARVYQGERVAARARARPGRAADLPRCSAPTPSDSRTGRRYARTTLVFSALFFVVLLRDPAHPGDPPVQPRGLRLGPLGRDLQHHRVVHHQHELAVLRRRDHALVLLADGRAGGAELRLGRGRHGGARRGDPRLRQPRRHRARQLLAGPHPHAALHPAAALAHRRARARLAGRGPDPQRLRDLSTPSRASTRRWRSARRRRRSRSSSWARTAAASSTSTARCRSRTRPRSRTSSRCCSSC